MGTTFCNLFCRSGQAELVKTKIDSRDGFLPAMNGWCMVLAEDRSPERMKALAKTIPGDSLVFYYFDDDYFELTLYQNGRKASSINSEGKGTKLSVMAGLLPEDPSALKKLRAVGQCAFISEKTALLEQTFGLPFYALHGQESVPAVRRSDEVWNTVRARMEALRNRPNRFRTQALRPEEWPDSVRIEKELADLIRKEIPSFNLCTLLFDLQHRVSTVIQQAPAYRILLPYSCRPLHEGPFYGYNRMILADHQQREVRTYTFHDSISRPLWVNRAGSVLCEALGQDGIVCLNEQGDEQWRFTPVLEHEEHLTPVLADPDGIVLCSFHAPETKAARLWRISPDDGHISTERSLPLGEDPYPLRWLTDMECFTYYLRDSNRVVLLDRSFREQRRFHLGNKRIRFDTGFYSGHYGYTPVPQTADNWDLASLDLVSGELKLICPEVPVFIDQILSGSILKGWSDERSGTLTLLDLNGNLISRHRFKDHLIGLWEENGRIYAATTKSDNVLGSWNDSDVTVYLFTEDPVSP